MPVTWRNIGTVSGAGLIAAANRAGQGIGEGIASIGKAFSDYGDRKKQDETDLAVNALRAATPGEREGLLQDFADSNISMDSKQIGAAADKIDAEERLVAGQELSKSNANRTFNLAREKFDFDKSEVAREGKQDANFMAAISGVGSGGTIAQNKANLIKAGARATTSKQRAMAKSAEDANQAAGEAMFNDFRMAASGKGYNSSNFIQDATSVSEQTGTPIGDVLKAAPALTNEYIYNRATTGTALEETQSLNDALAKVELSISGGSSDDIKQAQAEMVNTRKNLNLSVKKFQDELVSSNIDIGTVARFMESPTSPHGATMAKAARLEKVLSDRSSDIRKDARKAADDYSKSMVAIRKKNTPLTIKTYFMSKHPDREFKGEIDALQRNAEKALQGAPKLLKGDNQWALVESIKELSTVGDSWLGTERKWFPEIDEAYNLALQKIGVDPMLMQNEGINSEKLQEAIDEVNGAIDTRKKKKEYDFTGKGTTEDDY